MQSNVEWKKWGEVDPLFGVATWEGKGRGDSHPWTDEEFYELGRSDWTDFKKHWEQFGVEPGVCLEIGCGAGRITRQLATSFRSVKAVDVSEGMIGYARKSIDSPNIDFILANGVELPLPDKSVDAVFSTHVFQHFEALGDTTKYLDEIERVMVDGGTLLIHLPIYILPKKSAVYRVILFFRAIVSGLKARYKRFLIERGIWAPYMRGLHYEVDWLTDKLGERGFDEVEFRIFNVKSNNRAHHIVLAKKRC